ncbi:MAG: aminodeoxychorismate/anthranilate synthase component II [Bacteriovoracia bacterium]
MKATFIDFEDSFSFNVVQELVNVGFDVMVINWKDYEENPDSGLLVAGPGPGHPDDYQKIFPLLHSWLKDDRPFFGVCLGHQIFWRLQNEDVIRSKEPLHGQKIKLRLTEEWRKWLGIEGEAFVQRYNSLAVLSQSALRNPVYQNFIQDDEILITRGTHLLTYQFHPESIGTTYRIGFMRAVCSIV